MSASGNQSCLVCLQRVAAVLYQSYPANWPEFTPRDKFAQWLEQYAITQDLVVWTSSQLLPHPKYDHEKHEWEVTILRNGRPLKLHPKHIVLATGTLGKPYVPDVPGQDVFRGQAYHSTSYHGPAIYAGKRVVVVGAGNTAIDICQDLALNGAESVTMIQRSSTCVLGRDFVSGHMREEWPENVPHDVSDLRRASMPFGLQRKLNIATQDYVWQAEKELHDKLRKGGVRLNMGPDGSGLFILTLGRFGGTLMPSEVLFACLTNPMQCRSM